MGRGGRLGRPETRVAARTPAQTELEEVANLGGDLGCPDEPLDSFIWALHPAALITIQSGFAASKLA